MVNQSDPIAAVARSMGIDLTPEEIDFILRLLESWGFDLTEPNIRTAIRHCIENLCWRLSPTPNEDEDSGFSPS